MDSRHLDQLRSELRSKGYTRSYIDRLCGELLDHAMCVEEESDAASNTSGQQHQTEGLRRLGNMVDISRTVQANPELLTWVQRNPASVFVIMPAIAVCLLCLAMIFGLWVFSNLDDQPVLRHTLINSTVVLRFIAPFVLVVAISFVAIQRRIAYQLPIISAAVFCIGAFVCVDVADCSTSNSTFFRTYWGWSTPNFTAPWVACFLPLVAAVAFRFPVRWSTVHSSTSRWRREPIQNKLATPAIRYSSVGLCLAVLFATLYMTVEKARTIVSTHAADGLVRSVNAPGKMKQARINQLKKTQTRDALSVTHDQARQLTSIFAEHDQLMELIFANWAEEYGERKPIPMDRFDEIFAGTDERLTRILNPNQLNMLEKFAYQHLGANILFRSEIQKQLHLSFEQQVKLKDIELARIKAHQAFKKTKSIKTWNVAMQQQLLTISGPFHNEMLGLLSNKQRQQLVEIRGGEFGDDYQSHR